MARTITRAKNAPPSPAPSRFMVARMPQDHNSPLARQGMRTESPSARAWTTMTHRGSSDKVMPEFAVWLWRKGKRTIWLRPTCPRCLGALTQKMGAPGLICLDCNGEYDLRQARKRSWLVGFIFMPYLDRCARMFGMRSSEKSWLESRTR